MDSHYYRYRPSSYNANMDTSIKRIILQTTNSYSGVMPVYIIDIDVSSRKILFDGGANTIKPGIHHGILSALSMGFLVELIEGSHFFGMNTEYLSGESDLSFAKLTIILKDGRYKTIMFDEYARPAILLAIKIIIVHEVNRAHWLD